MKKFSTSILIALLFYACLSAKASEKPIDPNASRQTVRLYKNLKMLAGKGILFGHQDDLAYGVNWKYKEKRSDIKDITGEYPAVFGWDLAGLEKGSSVNIDSVPFRKIKQYIRQVYDQGGVNTISMHIDNPFNGKTAWDKTKGSVASILPGGEKNALYNTWLDKIASFLKSLKGSDKKDIPILFRPYHELTGDWFWWGSASCTPEEFKALWRYTVSYLRDTRKVHNLLYVYNTSDLTSAEKFMESYPGDDYVDVMSFDEYDHTKHPADSSFVKKLDKHLSTLDSLAIAHNKIAALAETGQETIPYGEWWTNVLAKAMSNHRIAYVLLWRNAGYMPLENKYHYYVPYKGHPSASDFIRFFNQDKILFEKKTRKLDIYR